MQQNKQGVRLPGADDTRENGKMQTIGRWDDTAEVDDELLEPETVRPSPQLAATKGLDKRVAHDADHIVARLERYREGLEADEAKIASALENVRADLKEVAEVIQTLRPAVKIVGKMCSRADEEQKLQETVRAIATPKAEAG